MLKKGVANLCHLLTDMTRTTPKPPTPSSSHHRIGSLDVKRGLDSVAKETNSQRMSNAAEASTTNKSSEIESMGRDVPPSRDAGDESLKNLLHKQLRKCESEMKKQHAELSDLIQKNEELYVENDCLSRELKRAKAEAAKGYFHYETLNKILHQVAVPYTNSEEHNTITWDADSLLRVLIDMHLELDTTREQLLGLQKEMLVSVEKVYATSDEEFARDFRNIVSSVKTLSREVIRASEVQDLVDVLGQPLFLADTAGHHGHSKAGKKFYIEAWIWCTLVNHVFKLPFTFSGCAGKEINTCYSTMFAAEVGLWPVRTLQSEAWRCVTMECLGKTFVSKSISQWGSAGSSAFVADPILDQKSLTFAEIESHLKKVCPSASIPSAATHKIIDKCFALAIQMCSQKTHIRITHPTIGENFDRASMQATPGGDGEERDDGVVCFIVNPGLTKWGDADGKRLEIRYDIVPALVQLESFLH